MSILSSKDIGQLSLRGIERRQDAYGTQYYFSPSGLYWLFNTLYRRSSIGKKPLLTNELLKAVANAPVDKDWRTLRMKASELPVYTDSVFQITFYLNGTPPRILQNTDPLTNIGGDIRFLDRSNVLGVVEGIEAFLKLTEQECECLMQGGYLERNAESKPW